MKTFAYTILYVKDVAKTMDFYKKAFELEQKLVTPDNSYGELQTGNTTLSFASFSMAEDLFKDQFVESSITQKPFGIEIGFTTDDVEATLQTVIDAGATLVQQPKTKPWGQVVAYVRDLDGFLIEICTPMS